MTRTAAAPKCECDASLWAGWLSIRIVTISLHGDYEGSFLFFIRIFFLGSVPRLGSDRSINWIDLDNLDQISIFTEAENLTIRVGGDSLASTTAEPKLNREWLFRSRTQDTKQWVPFQFQCAE